MDRKAGPWKNVAADTKESLKTWIQLLLKSPFLSFAFHQNATPKENSFFVCFQLIQRTTMTIFSQCAEQNPNGGDALLQCVADTAEAVSVPCDS
jgi:hypothetical protein